MRNKIIGISGMRGHGKSTVLRKTLASESRLIIVDTLGEHGGWTEQHRGTLGEAVSKIINGDFQRLSLWLPSQEDEQQLHFLYYCKAVYVAARRHGAITMAVEEADWYSKPNWENEGLKLIIQYGRHGPVNLVWTARNLGSVSRKLTSETDLYVLFRVSEPAWLDSLNERLGVEVGQRVASLSPYHYIIVDNGGNIVAESETEP